MNKPKIGDYVLATKFSDGDPGDAWAVGHLNEIKDGRFFVGNNDTHSFRHGGYAGDCMRISGEVGAWLLQNARILEACHPGSINLLKMINPLDIEEFVSGGSDNKY